MSDASLFSQLRKVTNPSCHSLCNLSKASKKLHRSGLRQISQGAFCLANDLALSENPSTLLHALKPNIVTTGSKGLTTDLLFLFFVKIATTFNFQFLNTQKAI